MAALEFVVPVYRTAPFLRETLRSLLSQRDADVAVTVRLVEVPAGTEREALGVDLATLPTVRVLRAERGLGIGGDWEAALNAAEAPLVTLAHSDDLYDAGYAAAMVDAFRSFPSAAVAFCAAAYTDASPRRRVIRAIRWGLNPARLARRTAKVPGRAMAASLRLASLIPCPSVAYNKPVLRSALGSTPIFDPTMRTALDWKAWLDLAERGLDFVYVPEPLMTLRVHEGSTTQATIKTGDRSREERAILERA